MQKDASRESYADDKDLIEKVVGNLTIETCWIILRLADRALTVSEMADFVWSELETHRGKLDSSQEQIIGLGYGFLVAMNGILKGTLYTFEHVDNEKTILRISSYAKEQLFKRIQTFGNYETA